MNADDRIAEWLARELKLPNASAGQLLSGGNVNLTRLIETDGGPVVLRHPPAAAISPRSADGIRREAAILDAVKDAGVTPRLLGFCEDLTVIGAPFMVMSFAEGVSITDRLPPAYADRGDPVDRLGESLIDGIAAIHRTDPGPMRSRSGDPDTFVPRQVERWLDLRQSDAVRDLPLLRDLGAWLLSHQPQYAPASIIHGDYHLDNTLCRTNEPVLSAIIDWELATVADPLFDLALFLMFWGPRSLSVPAFPHVQAVTRDRPVMSRVALAERWARLTGRSITNLPYFCCFAFWRLAAMVEGSYVLHVRGKATSDYARDLEQNVPRLLEEAAMMASTLTLEN